MPNLKINDFLSSGVQDPIRGALSAIEFVTNLFNIPEITPVIVSNTSPMEEDGRIVKKQTIRFEDLGINLQARQTLFASAQNSTFLDHRATLFVPSQEDDDFSSFNYSLYMNDSFSYYNIKNEDYEDITIFGNEKELPNFLIGALYFYDQGPEQEDLYTMLGSVPSLINSEMVVSETEINNYEFDSDFIDQNNYVYDYEYENMVDYFKHLVMSSSVDRELYGLANTHVFVNYDYTSNESKLISNVPFFNKIRIPFNNNDSPICDIFKTNGFSDRLLMSLKESDFSFRDFNVSSVDTPIKIFDLMSEVENFSQQDEITSENNIFLRKQNREHSYDLHPFDFFLTTFAIKGQLNQKMTENILDFNQLVQLNSSHVYEHIGYKIQKSLTDSNSVIQTFYFLNTEGLQDFVDTQIKFEQSYEYKIIGIFAIYGSEYTYENLDFGTETDDYIQFDFVNKCSLKIAEVELTTHTMRIVEPPPIPPEVTFYNEKNKKNMLKIRLEHQDGNIVDEYNKKPLRPFNNNEEYISRLSDYFKTDNILQTSGKTSAGVYEVYKLDRPPLSYSDFEDGFLTTVGSNVNYSNGERSKSVMLKDKIKHQQKYYYTFRCLTHRGNASELSPIFVVEMYEDADETFMTYDIYEIPKISPRTKFKKMRKYIQILPNQEHTVVNEDELLEDHPSSAEVAKDYIVFGDTELDENLFEFNSKKKYIKLRLESENSGRKMDINLFFKKKETTN